MDMVRCHRVGVQLQQAAMQWRQAMNISLRFTTYCAGRVAYWWGVCALVLAFSATCQAEGPRFPEIHLSDVRRLPPVPLAEKLAETIIDTFSEHPAESEEPPLELMPEELSPFRRALDSPGGEFWEVEELSPLEAAIEDIPEIPPPTKIWSGRIELGFNGASGNSDLSNLRAAGKLRRETNLTIFTFDINYNSGTNRGKRTEDQLLADSRLERIFLQSRWSGFIHSSVDNDPFTAYHSRFTADAGTSYSLIRGERAQLKIRMGWGAMRELQGPNAAEWVPEGSYGYEFSKKLWARQKFTAKTDAFFDLRDYTDYRMRTDAGWESKIDQSGHLSVRLSSIHRYDSTPGDRKPSDLTYSAQIVWDF